MSQEFFIVDAFTERAFAGNPAAVCLMKRARSDVWMQAVATELNLSETAFVTVPGESQGSLGLRWFTPQAEVDLCGHATLASAHVLWQTGTVSVGEQIEFDTRSGCLGTVQNDQWIEMDFPSDPPEQIQVSEPLCDALGIAPSWFGRSRLYDFAEVENEATLRSIRPKFEQLVEMVKVGICVTARSDTDREFDFVSRFFAPAVGIPEDPVTGSAHCLLAPYWSGKLGRLELTGYQASARGGVVKVRFDGDRTLVSGQAVTVAQGRLID